jgi:hypothetical protein
LNKNFILRFTKLNLNLLTKEDIKHQKKEQKRQLKQTAMKKTAQLLMFYNQTIVPQNRSFVAKTRITSLV